MQGKFLKIFITRKTSKDRTDKTEMWTKRGYVNN